VVAETERTNGDDVFSPYYHVETELGEHIRQEGIRIVTKNYASLAKRASLRTPTMIERKDLSQAENALNALQGMAPLGKLIPSRVIGKEWPT
jgi:hypothetical protein